VSYSHLRNVLYISLTHMRRNAGVRFQLLPPPGSMSTSPNLNIQGLPDKLEIIQDLCSTIQSAGQPCLGFYLDPISQDPLSRCVLRGTYPAAQRPICRGHDLVTLEQMLFSPQTNSWQPLTEEDRYLLAITLVASFAQLHDTPWIGKRWSERDVLFCEEATRINTAHRKRIDVRHPFVTKTYDLDCEHPIRPQLPCPLIGQAAAGIATKMASTSWPWPRCCYKSDLVAGSSHRISRRWRSGRASST
jgi:hypothetical protein